MLVPSSFESARLCELKESMRPPQSPLRPYLIPAFDHAALRIAFCMACLVLAGGVFSTVVQAEPADAVHYSADILPILSENCFTCHGPDSKARKADLRLDLKESALRKKEPVIVPGKSGESELIERVPVTIWMR